MPILKPVNMHRSLFRLIMEVRMRLVLMPLTYSDCLDSESIENSLVPLVTEIFPESAEWISSKLSMNIKLQIGGKSGPWRSHQRSVRSRCCMNPKSPTVQHAGVGGIAILKSSVPLLLSIARRNQPLPNQPSVACAVSSVRARGHPNIVHQYLPAITGCL